MGIRGKHVHPITVKVKSEKLVVLAYQRKLEDCLRTTSRKYHLGRRCSGDLGPLGLIIGCCGVTEVNSSAGILEQY